MATMDESFHVTKRSRWARLRRDLRLLRLLVTDHLALDCFRRPGAQGLSPCCCERRCPSNRRAIRAGQVQVMRPRNPPPAEYAFTYGDPPKSGNLINGLGETKRRRPDSIFHGTGNEVLGVECARPPVRHAEYPVGHVVQREKSVAAAPRQWTHGHRTHSDRRSGGADRNHQREGPLLRRGSRGSHPRDRRTRHVRAGDPLPERHLPGIPHGPGRRCSTCPGGGPTGRSCAPTSSRRRPPCCSRNISGRSVGRRRAYGLNCNDIQQLPLAISAGLGQLGKHGSLICPEHGSNLRLGDRADRSAACTERAGRHRRRRSLHGVPEVPDRLPARRHPRPEADGTRHIEMVCRFRQMRALLHQDLGVRNLHRGLPLERTRARCRTVSQTVGQTKRRSGCRNGSDCVASALEQPSRPARAAKN